jgi:hypothetical protein
MTAVGHGDGFVPAVDVVDPLMLGVRRRVPALPICPQGHQDVEEVLALLRELVLEANRVVLIGHRLNYPDTDKAFETTGERVACDAKAFDELVEATDTKESITQYQDGPRVVDHLHRVGNGAFQVIEGLSGHQDSLVSFELQFTLTAGTFSLSCKLQPTLSSRRVEEYWI